MNLKELLSRVNKREETSEEEKEKKLLVFLLLYYKSHLRDTYINYGEGAKLLYNWLEVEDIPITDKTKNLPLGMDIGSNYLMYNILGLHPTTVYTVLENFRLAKNPNLQ